MLINIPTLPFQSYSPWIEKHQLLNFPRIPYYSFTDYIFLEDFLLYSEYTEKYALKLISTSNYFQAYQIPNGKIAIHPDGVTRFLKHYYKKRLKPFLQNLRA